MSDHLNTLPTIERARAYAWRNRIRKPGDWARQMPGIDPWNVYESFKHELALDVSPSDVAWRPAVRLLCAALAI